MSADETVIAVKRFGLGPRPGDLGRLKGPIAPTLLAEAGNTDLDAPLTKLPTGKGLFSGWAAEQEAKKLGNQAPQPSATSSQPATMAPLSAGTMPTPDGGSPTPRKAATSTSFAMLEDSGSAQGKTVKPETPGVGPVAEFVRQTLLGELQARLDWAMAAPTGFRQRLSQFWANHFTVAGPNPAVLVQAGALEREAILPHLTGRFADMLAAVESHPAMLLYLNNERSMGPNSLAGKRQSKGLNENLAREIMELHTLGVDGGYTQTDVTTFAGVITGWSVVGRKGIEGEPGAFIFRERMHEPGTKHVLGRDYTEDGVDQGRAVLADLAKGAPTAQHIAVRLARHFIADSPPKPAVEAIAKAFKDTDGSLTAVYEALLKVDGALTAPSTKLRSPLDYTLAAHRATGGVPDAQAQHRALALMGQQPFFAPSPQGWPDDSMAWLAPDAIRTRLDFADLIAHRAKVDQPVPYCEALLGPILTDETRTAIRQAESPSQALALLLMSPEFQRR
jgi:uncharacterized protein (DUF1800 family)